MVKAKGGPIAADGLYEQRQSPFPTLPDIAAALRLIPLRCQNRERTFDDVAHLSQIELTLAPATFVLRPCAILPLNFRSGVSREYQVYHTEIACALRCFQFRMIPR